MKINIFSLIIFFLLINSFKVFAEDIEIYLSENNDLKCRYKVESKNDVINSTLNCKNYINDPIFIEGWDQKNCKSENYKFKINNNVINKVAIYCLTFDEEKYIQVY